jgi:hypothetical protein
MKTKWKPPAAEWLPEGFAPVVATYFWAKASKSKQKTPFQDL